MVILPHPYAVSNEEEPKVFTHEQMRRHAQYLINAHKCPGDVARGTWLMFIVDALEEKELEKVS